MTCGYWLYKKKFYFIFFLPQEDEDSDDDASDDDIDESLVRYCLLLSLKTRTIHG